MLQARLVGLFPELLKTLKKFRTCKTPFQCPRRQPMLWMFLCFMTACLATSRTMVVLYAADSCAVSEMLFCCSCSWRIGKSSWREQSNKGSKPRIGEACQSSERDKWIEANSEEINKFTAVWVFHFVKKAIAWGLRPRGRRLLLYYCTVVIHRHNHFSEITKRGVFLMTHRWERMSLV